MFNEVDLEGYRASTSFKKHVSSPRKGKGGNSFESLEEKFGIGFNYKKDSFISSVGRKSFLQHA